MPMWVDFKLPVKPRLAFLLCLEYFQSHQSYNSTGGIDTIFVGSPAIGL